MLKSSQSQDGYDLSLIQSKELKHQSKYSSIYKIKLRDQVHGLKEIKDKDLFDLELKIMTQVKGQPYFVQHLFHDSLGRRIVMEWAQGDLVDYINDCKEKDGAVTAQRVKFMNEILSAMIYLHSQNILHRDIKPENVLLSSEGICKLTDFNLCEMLEEGESKKLSSKSSGTVEFLAPECFIKFPGDQAEYSFSTDLWAFAVTFWILINQSRPYFEYYNSKKNDYEVGALMLAIVLCGHTPDATQIEEGPIRNLAVSLWKKDPANRPKSAEVKGILEEEHQRLCKLKK